MHGCQKSKKVRLWHRFRGTRRKDDSNERKIRTMRCTNCDSNEELLAKHQYECDECETFVCNRCEQRVSWNRGCADDMPTLCDDCWHTFEGGK